MRELDLGLCAVEPEVARAEWEALCGAIRGSRTLRCEPTSMCVEGSALSPHAAPGNSIEASRPVRAGETIRRRLFLARLSDATGLHAPLTRRVAPLLSPAPPLFPSGESRSTRAGCRGRSCCEGGGCGGSKAAARFLLMQHRMLLQAMEVTTGIVDCCLLLPAAAVGIRRGRPTTWRALPCWPAGAAGSKQREARRRSMRPCMHGTVATDRPVVVSACMACPGRCRVTDTRTVRVFTRNFGFEVGRRARKAKQGAASRINAQVAAKSWLGC